jgi:dipeptide/tripeptide permease
METCTSYDVSQTQRSKQLQCRRVEKKRHKTEDESGTLKNESNNWVGVVFSVCESLIICLRAVMNVLCQIVETQCIEHEHITLTQEMAEVDPVVVHAI